MLVKKVERWCNKKLTWIKLDGQKMKIIYGKKKTKINKQYLNFVTKCCIEMWSDKWIDRIEQRTCFDWIIGRWHMHDHHLIIRLQGGHLYTPEQKTLGNSQHYFLFLGAKK